MILNTLKSDVCKRCTIYTGVKLGRGGLNTPSKSSFQQANILIKLTLTYLQVQPSTLCGNLVICESHLLASTGALALSGFLDV